MGGFNSAIANGVGVIVRKALTSLGYTPHVSGWSIMQNGSAEFNNVTVRGDMIVNGTGNSSIEIILDNNGLPFVFIRPKDITGHTIGAGQIDSIYGANNAPSIEILTPTVDGGSAAAIQLYGTDTVGNAPSIALSGDATFNNTCNHLSDVDFLPALANTEISFWGLVTDTLKRLAIDGNGHHAWGPGGSTARDTVLYRSGIGTLGSSPIVADVSGSGETWHTFTLQNGWTNLGGGFVTAQYRKVASPANEVECRGVIQAGTKTDGTIIATLPAGYWPVSRQRFIIAASATVSGGRTPSIDVDTSGNLIIFGCTAASDIEFSFFVSLDA